MDRRLWSLPATEHRDFSALRERTAPGIRVRDERVTGWKPAVVYAKIGNTIRRFAGLF
jgi:hypothetical protein